MIHPLLDGEKQERARRYEKEKRLFGLAGTAQSLALLIVFSLTGGSGRTAVLLGRGSPVLSVPLYSVVLITLLFLVGLPLSFLAGFRHEHHWGFSNQTKGDWIRDQVKSYSLSLVLGTILFSLFVWILFRFPTLWWLIAGLASALVGVILATLLPVVILPLFNTYTPIEESDLISALDHTLHRGGLRSSGFFREDSSRRTKKENAFLAGLGTTRRVVLADNLMEHMTLDEIEAIVAHEVGHFNHKHIWKSLSWGTFQQLVLFFILDGIMRSRFPSFPGSTLNALTLFPWLLLFGGVISSLILGPFGHALSRHFEKQADAYAAAAVKDSHALCTALAGLADRNLSNAYPPGWIKILFYSHPPVGERLRDICDGRTSGGPGPARDTP